MEIDTDRIDEATLALLYLGLHDRYRAWKGFDWGPRWRRPRSWCRRPRGAFGVAQRAAGGPEAVIAGLR